MPDIHEFPDSSNSVSKARQFARESLTGLEAETVDSVALLVSEIATNSVLHARTGFSVSVEIDPNTVRVAVTDGDDHPPVLRSVSPEAISGRGLRIVEQLADAWGVTSPTDGGGKSVWFTVHRPAECLTRN